VDRPDLYASATLRVVPNVTDAARLDSHGFELITFEPLWRGNRRRPFGESFAVKYGLNALHIVPADISWYQYPDMEACLAAVARHAAPGAAVVGASMGGYAAVTFADRIGAARSVALAPQYSIQRRLVPFETRWAAEAEATAFFDWDGSLAQRCRHYVFFDPLTPDADHASLIAAHAPDVVPMPLPGGGHTIGKVLAEAGALSLIVLRVLREAPSAESLQAEIAPRLETSPQYHLNRAQQGPADEREAALRAGLVLDPQHIWLQAALGTHLTVVGRHADALPYLTFAVLRRPLHRRLVRSYLAVCARTRTEPDPRVAEAAAQGATPEAGAAD
jgi:pimeloyl-ACP methyl ester carboxylesterase